MNDELRSIGRSGTPGRGSKARNPSAAARSLAGAKVSARKPPVKKRRRDEASGGSGDTVASGDTGASAEANSEPRRKEPKKQSTPASSSGKGTRPRHVRVVTDEELAAAAAAAEDAAKLADEARTQAESEDSDSLGGSLGVEEMLDALVSGAQRVLGETWQKRLNDFLAFGMARLSGDYEVDDFGLDPQISRAFYSLVEPLAESWFRLEVRGVENIPTDGGALLVANHSGTIPVDGLVTGYAVQKHTGRPMRALGADLVFSLPFVGLLARKVGATLACTDDAERLLRSGELAAVWPEGFKGVGKPFSERYKLQRFGRGGFVSSAMVAQVPIIPVSIVGAEEIYPLVGNIPSLARLLGVPYVPITPLFPAFGPLGLVPLPSKWIIEFGEPIRTDAYSPEAADDPMLLFNVTDQVRETIQQTLYKLLIDRGHPFF